MMQLTHAPVSKASAAADLKTGKQITDALLGGPLFTTLTIDSIIVSIQ